MNMQLPPPVRRRSIMLLVTVAMLTLALIGLAGMSASVLVVERARSSTEAIKVAGSLRLYAQRIPSLAAVDSLGGRGLSARGMAVSGDFERQLEHPALAQAIARAPQAPFAVAYRGVHAAWRSSLQPRFEALSREGALSAAGIEQLLAEVDAFVEQIDVLVAALEHDSEARIHRLHQALALAMGLTLIVAVIALGLLYRALLRPLGGLLEAARRIAGGDFSARVRNTGEDEIGRVGTSFNLMAGELEKLYGNLGRHVAEKTAELQRSNRALELLYHAITRLYHSPTAPEAYAATLRDIDRVAGLSGSFVCIEPQAAAAATVIASTFGVCPERIARGEDACAACRISMAPGNGDLLRFPLRDREHHYGMLRLALPPGASLEDWQRQLVEALSRHIGMALGAARRGEQERLLALQEERSVIARELHDSLAQALSYMKIQASLLQRVAGDPARAAEAGPILVDLRAGINAAYRQLRELLVSFRLGLSGDLDRLLGDAVREYGARGKLEVTLELRLGDCVLSPNQEVHVLQIVREALSNMVRHAGARRARVAVLGEAGGEVRIEVEDDGVGLGAPPEDARNHHGLSIMRERARSLGGGIEIGNRAEGGTRVRVRFAAARVVAGGAFGGKAGFPATD